MLTLQKYFIKNKLLKVFIGSDIVFYEICFDDLNINFVYSEDDFYNDDISGIPTVLKLQKGKNYDFEIFPHSYLSRFNRNQKYCVLEYRYLFGFSTNSVATKSALSLKKISLKKCK
ncbi:hypothetical protein [Polaribacter sargassicola]|uniref:hypothetical protein n=1 Tax=Polaribacter sargassicola TaxID=2836891 RepID=UPI001F1BFB9E|nr:hypothetical protein [Polaribacter sp. DS7-9]MCG1035530.1 hypothetical protein [Polaribacter sp. DS7-9]